MDSAKEQPAPDEAKALDLKGDSYGQRLIQLYSPDMIKAWYAHYQNLSEAEGSAGSPHLARYYQAVADALYEHVTVILGKSDEVEFTS